MHREFWSEALKEGDSLEDIKIGGRITVKLE
jgi:hypothetical protein